MNELSRLIKSASDLNTPSTEYLEVFGIASLITLKVMRRKKCQHQMHS
jgi:hypothetical protein